MQFARYPGEVVLISELSIINLRPSGDQATDLAAHLSIYDVRYAPGVTPGSVAFIRHHASPDQHLSAGVMLTDSPSAARYLIARLRSVNWTVIPLEQEPRSASFTRSVGVDSVRVRAASEEIELLAEWRGLFGSEWGDGPSNNYPNQHTWAFVMEASEARLSINGVVVDGEIFPDERFRPMYGAPISSASIGLAEVSVELDR